MISVQDKKINIVLPTLHIDDKFLATIASLAFLEDVLGRIIVVAPEKVCSSQEAAAFPAVEFFPERSTGVYACFNQAIEELKGETGYALFLGVGDLTIGISDVLKSSLLAYPESILTGVVRFDSALTAPGQPELLFRKAGPLLSRLPHHQGILYRCDVLQTARYPEDYKIYGDVLQRAKVLQSSSFVTVDLPVVATEPAGLSSYNDLRRTWLHASERFRLVWPLIGLREPLLAGRYVVGISRVVMIALKNSLRLKKRDTL
jgi:hypothetical protein